METKDSIQHLYVQIPFFKKSSFNSKESKIKNTNSYFIFLENIKNELNQVKDKYQINLRTIYIGNNTVFSLPISILKELLILLKPFIKNVKEFSFECSFSSINIETLQLLKQYNVNRLVWKVITFQEDLNKNHNYNFNYEQSINLINNAIDLGFTNFSLDLKYNLPNQTSKQIVNDLQICLKLKAPHISYDSYNENQNLIIKKIINKFLKNNNYQHYEYYSYAISTKVQSQYTIAYCLLKNYYGIGIGAISYIENIKGATLITNSINFKNYQKKITHLSQKQVFINHLIQGLFLKKGIYISEHNKKYINEHKPLIDKLIKNKQIIIKNKQLFCTNTSWILLNDLIVDIISNNNY